MIKMMIVVFAAAILFVPFAEASGTVVEYIVSESDGVSITAFFRDISGIGSSAKLHCIVFGNGLSGMRLEGSETQVPPGDTIPLMVKFKPETEGTYNARCFVSYTESNGQPFETTPKNINIDLRPTLSISSNVVQGGSAYVGAVFFAVLLIAGALVYKKRSNRIPGF